MLEMGTSTHLQHMAVARSKQRNGPLPVAGHLALACATGVPARISADASSHGGDAPARANETPRSAKKNRWT